MGCLMEPGSRDLGQAVIRHGPIDALGRLLSGALAPALQGAVAARLSGGDPRSVAEVALARAERLGARIVTPLDEEWPARLADLARISRGRERHQRDTYPPLCLWLRGPWPLAEALDRSIAVVGARAATGYGEHVAAELAYGVADRGWTVVSGGAYGIDSAAHRGTLSAGGVTVAVLACGVDRAYPASNASLFERIAETGLLISEWPPGAEPHRHRFLIRNRVIAAATVGTVVVEAAARSGAIQTLRRASELGRIAMAVPGPVTSAMSVGTHEALRSEEVRLVTGWAHVLEEVGRIGADLAPVPRGPERSRDRLDPVTAQVLDAVGPRVAGAEHIAASAGVSLTTAMTALGMLSAAGFVVTRDGGYALPRRPSSARA
ncbi:MAG: DNA-processing protein DprA [Micromonosporaceae bacterium]